MSNKTRIPGQYCAAYGCLNKATAASPTANLIFFKLPSELERCKIWLKLINREDLLERKDFKSNSYCICSDHFNDDDIDSNSIRKLKKDAIPTKNLYKNETHPSETPREEVESLKANIQHNSEKTCILNLDDITYELEKRHVGVMPTIDDLQPSTSKNSIECYSSNIKKQIGRSVSETLIPGHKRASKNAADPRSSSALKKRKLDTTNSEEADKKGYFKNESQDTDLLAALSSESSSSSEFMKRLQKLLQWQANMKKFQKFGDFDPEFKFFALNLYLSSPQAYQSLKPLLKLPSEFSLSKHKLHIRPDLDQRLLKCLSSKLQSLSDTAKYCTLCVGVVTLKPHVYYDVTHDDIIGLHNINGNVKNKIASYAYVVMLRGIAVNWKQIIAYSFLARNEHYEELDYWINEIILQLHILGIKVMAIVSDQAPIFTKYAKENKKVTTQKPYFTVHDHKIYYIFDVPNLLTNLRNDLLENDFFIEGERISWDYIETMYHHQNEERLGLIPNVTMAHIEPTHSQKTQVRYAAQIFSQSMYGALNTFIYAEFLPEEARATADFIKSINDAFDALNSNTLNNNNKFQRAFTLNDEQVEMLDSVKSMFKIITAFCPTTGTNNTKNIGTFENFQVSIQAIMMLTNDLKKQGLNHIFTRRLNHDPLKTVIAAMEKKGKMPTVGVRFKRLFASVFMSNLVKNTRTYYYQGDLCDLMFRGDKILEEPVADRLKSVNPPIVSVEGETDYFFDIPPIDAITYVAAYLLFKCSEKHRCSQFEIYLQSATSIERSPYKHFKDINQKFAFYKSLKVPPESFLLYIGQLETKFLRDFKDSLAKHPGNTMLSKLRGVHFQTPCTCFPLEFLLKLYVRFRIFAVLNYNRMNLKVGKAKKRCLFHIKPL